MVKMKRLLVPGAALAAALMGHNALAELDPGVLSRTEFQSYFRAGLGQNSEGGDQVCFQTPGQPSKFRLGNECEVYGELVWFQPLYEGDDGAYFNAQIRLAYAFEGDSSYEEIPDGQPFLPEQYIEAGNVIGGVFEGSKFWVGKRFYRRHDVHMIDYYFLSIEGSGAGVEDISLGNLGNFAFAWHRVEADEFDIDGDGLIENEPVDRNSDGDFNDANEAATEDTSDKLGVNNFDFRLYEIPVNPGGTLLADAQLRFADVNDTIDERIDEDDGYGFTLMHTQDMLGGFNKLALQYGSGIEDPVRPATTDVTIGGASDTYRIVEQFAIDPSPQWAISAVALWETKERTGGTQVDSDRWMVGVRPKYQFTDYLALAVEVGYDSFDPSNGPERNTFKATIAPMIQAGRGIFARPSLRLFVTYADWNDAAQAAGAQGGVGGPFGDDTSGFTFGAQGEVWW